MFSRKEEVFKDFSKALEKINFKSYNPFSQEFKETLFLGLMWKILCKMEERSPIMEEIEGVKKYMADYKTTGDNEYRSMASDEIRHAEILLKKARTGMPGGGSSKKLDRYEEEIRQLKSELAGG